MDLLAIIVGRITDHRQFRQLIESTLIFQASTVNPWQNDLPFQSMKTITIPVIQWCWFYSVVFPCKKSDLGLTKINQHHYNYKETVTFASTGSC